VLRRSLISYVARALHLPNLNDNAAVDESITNAFLSLDNEILSSGLAALKDDAPPATVISRMAPATAGSCALLAIFDPSTSNLRVACVGDSRAVLGRSNPENPGEWIAKPLSEDQTGFNKKELARILAQHPGESPVDLKSGRVLGIAVSRAFGDNRWKWPLEALQEQGKRFFGGQPRPTYFSPPYLTAEPVITTTKVQSGDFVVLASDGLWDRISSEDAVKCVSKWVEEVRKGTKLTGQSPVESNPVIQYPTEKKANDWKFHLEDMVVEEENAATNLVKNAFGGKRRDLFCSVVSSQTPHSRSVRDDITVQIIFFGDISEKAQK
jgi:pyruvate dehydrogenase phosphatase